MLKYCLAFLCVLFSVTAFAQHNPDDLIESNEWDLVATIKTKYIKPGVTSVSFPQEIKKFENKTFTLEGYMVPIKVGEKQTQFMLSSLPVNQCYYCGKNGVPMMVFVETTKPVRYEKYPVVVKGILKLNTAPNSEPVSLKMAGVE